jgi:hypothetical protein
VKVTSSKTLGGRERKDDIIMDFKEVGCELYLNGLGYVQWQGHLFI